MSKPLRKATEKLEWRIKMHASIPGEIKGEEKSKRWPDGYSKPGSMNRHKQGGKPRGSR